MATKSEVLELLDTLSDMYGAEPEEGKLKAYTWALEEYDASLFEAIAKDAVRFHSWYPKPAELRTIAENKRREAEREKEDDSNARMYWRSMDLFGALLRGSITEQQFYQDKSVKRQTAQNGLFEFEELIIEEA